MSLRSRNWSRNCKRSSSSWRPHAANSPRRKQSTRQLPAVAVCRTAGRDDPQLSARRLEDAGVRPQCSGRLIRLSPPRYAARSAASRSCRRPSCPHLPPAGKRSCRQNGSRALLQSVSREALANSSNRFAALQQLIDAIGSAADQKAILDLQARIAPKRHVAERAHEAAGPLPGAAGHQLANSQRARELVIAGHGQFANRFQPQP